MSHLSHICFCNKKKIPLCETKKEKIEFNYVESGYIELAYISPDWKVWKKVDLQNLCVGMAAEIMEIDNEVIQGAFYWAEDNPTHHKHLFVKESFLRQENRTEHRIRFFKDYLNGFFDAVGFM